MNEGTLFVVATPIGNLDDLSPRAREILAAADLVAAEDTRVTGRLLSHFGIDASLVAFHEHNEESRSESLIEALKSGKSVALVSDAGTPLISDPGYRLIGAAHRSGITVSPVPGPSALIAALSASGLPTDRFAFEGFLPAKKAARRKRLGTLAAENRTLVFYESVHRIAETLDDMIEVFGGDRAGAIGRELTKLHEQCVTADLRSLATLLADGGIPAKGEFVLAVAGTASEQPAGTAIDVDALIRELLAVVPGKQAADIAARVTGGNRNAIYQRMLALKVEKS